MNTTITAIDPVTFKIIAYIDAYESAILERKDYEIGKLELHLPYGVGGSDKIKEKMIVFSDPKNPYIVTGVDVEEKKAGYPMTITGKQLKGILDGRLTVPDIIAETLTYGYDRYPLPANPTIAAETVFKYYVNKHAVNPEDPKRIIPNLSIAPDISRGDSIRWSSRFEPLSTVFQSMGESTGIGYEISVDIINHQFIFDIVPGVDHSTSSADPVVFSTDFGNIETTKYSIDTSPEYTVGYAGGAGDGEERLIQAIYIGDPPSGFDRRETWLDCGSLDTVADLTYEANYKMQSLIRTETLSGEIAISGPFLLGTNFNLGDIVTVQSRRLGLEKDIRITEITESYEKGKKSIRLTFGKRKKKISDEIRKTEARR